MSVSLPPDRLADIQWLALSLLHTQHVTVHMVMSFLGKANFCSNGHSQLWYLCCVIQSDMLCVCHSPPIYFHMFIFPFPPYINWNIWLICNRAQFLCNFHFLIWLLLLMPHPCIGPFIFRDVGYLYQYQLVVLGQALCRAHIVLQEFQDIAMILHRMAFHLSGKVVALHLDNSTAKAYLCKQGGTVSPFLSSLACQILSQTDKHGITPIPAYIPTHLNVEADYLSQDWLFPEWHLLPQVIYAAFLLLGPSGDGPAGIVLFYSMPALLHLRNSTTSGDLGVECLQPS